MSPGSSYMALITASVQARLTSVAANSNCSVYWLETAVHVESDPDAGHHETGYE
ncbi:hypothetical protein Metal_2209 [Methylomicrobium album BG8]|uniref:Uncharacterized protein n=1 Tax=Methylomicrobium album BG8 TaxID=686340 RepID=H8GG33_METAL|nr:hypothetical protein Metal_2209 [Methylomicrobium album BG8]